jgi:ABC-2 type transport system ATP-binding protein
VNGAPLVSARDLRVDVDGAVALDHVTFEVSGRSLALWADSLALEGALAGTAAIRSGTLSLMGREVNARTGTAAAEAVGLAPFDPPLPPRWTVREYLLAGARLAGTARRGAHLAADRAIAELGLQALNRTELRELPVPERRAVVIAQAVVAEPALLVAFAPLAGLSGEHASYVAAVLAAASRDRSWIVSVRDLHPASAEHALATSADDVLGFAGGRVVQHGKLLRAGASTTGYTLVVRGQVEALRAALGARGVTLSGGPLRFFIELTTDLSPADILAISLAVHAPIVELVPRLATVALPPLEM